MDKRIEIKNDLFNISKRIKKIDRNYSIYFNYKSHNYEVFYRGELSFIVGKQLDNFALSKTHKTNIRNAKVILQNMLEGNEKIEKRESQDLEDKNKELLSNLVSFADKKGGDVDFSNINKTKWI